MKLDIKPTLRAVVLLFALSFIVTAAFSASLKVFFAGESWARLLGKGLLIPCFTWTVQLILSAVYMKSGRLLTYWTQLGVVCLIGSAALMPAALYNFGVEHPSPLVSILNVLASVALMGRQLSRRLKSNGFGFVWTLSWAVLIVVNMSLYLWSISASRRF
ncbi:MAG TPA: hypothetical protein VM934_05295 [Pyrinomonadaceae bacterium]|nr:hypothetical protein [Pyrinomonadaceae bacterium]